MRSRISQEIRDLDPDRKSWNAITKESLDDPLDLTQVLDSFFFDPGLSVSILDVQEPAALPQTFSQSNRTKNSAIPFPLIILLIPYNTFMLSSFSYPKSFTFASLKFVASWPLHS
jgi:hypothetical protein